MYPSVVELLVTFFRKRRAIRAYMHFMRKVDFWHFGHLCPILTRVYEKAVAIFLVVILGVAGNPDGRVAVRLGALRWSWTGSPLREDDGLLRNW